jgi:hypothetical protein
MKENNNINFLSFEEIMEYVKKRRNFYILPEYQWIAEDPGKFYRMIHPIRNVRKSIRELKGKHKNILYQVFGHDNNKLEGLIYLQEKFDLSVFKTIALFIRNDFSGENLRCELSGKDIRNKFFDIVKGWPLCYSLKYFKLIPYFYMIFGENTREVSKQILEDVESRKYGTDNVFEVMYVYKNNFVINNKCVRCGGKTKFKNIYSGYKKYCEDCIENYIKMYEKKYNNLKPLHKNIMKKYNYKQHSEVINFFKENSRMNQKIISITPWILKIMEKTGINKKSQILWHIENNDLDFLIGLCKDCGKRKAFANYRDNYRLHEINNEHGCFCIKHNKKDKNIKITANALLANSIKFNEKDKFNLLEHNLRVKANDFFRFIKKGLDPLEELKKSSSSSEKQDENICLSEKCNFSKKEKLPKHIHNDLYKSFTYNRDVAYDLYVQKSATLNEIAEMFDVHSTSIYRKLKNHKFFVGSSVVKKIERIKSIINKTFSPVYKPSDRELIEYLISINEQYVDNLIHIKNYKNGNIPLIDFIEHFDDIIELK